MERLLNLELTSYCDANCSMCPRDNVCEFGYITMETIDYLIKKVENYALFEISLSGRTIANKANKHRYARKRLPNKVYLV